VAHVYLGADADATAIRAILEATDGIDQVLAGDRRAAHGLDHDRAGDLVCISEPRRWFTWDYWLDERRAPDFARTVDIHRKPGYDPRELFLDPARPMVRSGIAWRLLRKRLGFRTLMDVIPLDTSLVRGSHGRTDLGPDRAPVLLCSEPLDGLPDRIAATDVRDLALRLLLD